MLVVTDICGHRDDPQFAGRKVESVLIAWDEAAKRRLRRRGDGGTDVAIDLPRGRFLADGAVLHADAERIIAVRRAPAPALLVRFDLGASREALVADAFRLGFALGNQHAPAELDGSAVAIPIVTSEELTRAALGELGLRTAEIERTDAVLRARAPARTPGNHGPGVPE